MVSFRLKEAIAGLRIQSDSTSSLEKVTYALALFWLTESFFGEPEDVFAGQTSQKVSRSNVHSIRSLGLVSQLRLISARTGLVLPPDTSMQPTSESRPYEFGIATTSIHYGSHRDT